MKKTFVVFGMIFAPFVAFGSCTSGHSLLTGAGTSFIAPVSGSCEAPGYTLMTIPDEYEVFYSGMVVGDEVTLCSNGRMVNGTCVTYTAGDCASGNVSLVENGAFMAPVNGSCDAPGYTMATLSNEFTGIYRGQLVGDEVTLCNGGRMVNGTCSSYGTGNCASGYYDLATDSNTFGAPTNETCSNPYSTISGTTRCDHNPGDTCVTIATPTIDVTYYNGNNQLETSTCYYGDVMTLPTPPTRPGYTFNRWVVSE